MTEANILKSILLKIGRACKLFRNNTGMGWTGEAGPVRTSGGVKYITIKNPRPLRAGLCTGSSDLIGWTPVLITPEMVGRELAVFTAIEVKTATGRASKDQINFIRNVREAGGIAGIARDPEGAEQLIKQF